MRLISANGAVFAINLHIYLETLSLQRENVPKLPACVLRLLLRKTGLWPVHDIKSFAIGAFLSSLLLKEQMIKKNLVQDNIKSKRDRKPSYKLSMFLISSRCFFLLHRLTLIIPPPPPISIIEIIEMGPISIILIIWGPEELK